MVVQTGRRPAPESYHYSGAILCSQVIVTAVVAILASHLVVSGVELSVEQLRALFIVTAGVACFAMLVTSYVLASVLAYLSARSER